MNGIFAIVFAVIAVAALAGLALVVRALMAERERSAGLVADLAIARARLDHEAAGAQRLDDAVKAQASLTANVVTEQLLTRAAETFKAQEEQAKLRLEAQLKPVSDTLAKFNEQVVAAEKARAEETGGLKAQIAALMQASADTQAEARKLSAALRRGAGVQGRWGEQTLRNVLEAAGLTKRFDFEEQYSVDSEEGRRRPDVKVRLPGGAVFVIDAKCSLNAFLEAQDAVDDAGRDAAMARHAQSVRAHIAGLSAKAYWDQFKAEGSPDFVAMFVPGERL